MGEEARDPPKARFERKKPDVSSRGGLNKGGSVNAYKVKRIFNRKFTM